MEKSVLDKFVDRLLGGSRPQHITQYDEPWLQRIRRAIRPPDKIPGRKQPMTPGQRRLIAGVVIAVTTGGLVWGGYQYFATTQERSMTSYREGMLLLGPNKLDDAYKKFSEAIQLWPENAGAYLERGNVSHKLGDDTGAQEDWARALELKPTLSDAYTARGTMHRMKGDLASALTDLNQAIDIGPTMDAYYQRGQVFQAQGSLKQALEDYTRSIDQQPNAPFVYRARAVVKSQLGDEAGSRADDETADRLQHIR